MFSEVRYLLPDIKVINLDIRFPSIIFLKGDLGSGKTTVSKHIINNLLGVKENILSPTYVYYNKYKVNNIDIFHFDLYRIKNYDEFFSIGGEEILDNNSGIILIEWPELISKYYESDICIEIQKTGKKKERIIKILSK